MNRLLRATYVAAIGLTLPVTLWGAASAMPGDALLTPMGVLAAASSPLVTVQAGRRGGGRGIGMRGGRNFGGYRGSPGRGNFGRNAGAGIAAAIIGGVILSESARATHRRTHSDAWERCQATYRSFEPSTGMYTGYDGVRRTCPYLR